METEDLITLILAIWGSGLSTLLALLRFKETKKSMQVQAGYGVHHTSSGPIPVIAITAINTGHRPFSIVGAGIEAGNILIGYGEITFTRKKQFHVIKQGVPVLYGMDSSKRIEEGERATIKFEYDFVRHALVGIPTIGIFVIDGEDKWHYAKISNDLKTRFRQPYEV